MIRVRSICKPPLTANEDFVNFRLRIETMLGEGPSPDVNFRSVSVEGKGSKPYLVPIGGTGARTFNKQPGKLIITDYGPVREAVDVPLQEPGKWFTLEIIADGNRIVIKVAGETVNDYREKLQFGRGPIGIGVQPNCTVRIRSIEIKRLEGR